MKKYIRTKDGRIIDLDRVVYGNKVIHLNENEIEGGNWSGWYWKTDEYGYEIECRDADIIKEADTIEELCDEFVMNNEVVIGSPRDGMNRLQLADYYAKKGKNVYGAIWTDKGLIYVAKMNEKGELELLWKLLNYLLN